VGPHRASISPPSGAKSGWHTHAKDRQPAADLLNRKFQAAAPNRVWVADFERHEAFANPGGGGKATVGCLSQQAFESWRTIGCLGMGVVGGAVLDNDESFQYCQMGRARLARRRGIREEPAAERPSRRNHRPPNLADMGRIASRTRWPLGCRGTSRLGDVAGRGGHGEGLRRSRGDGAGA